MKTEKNIDKKENKQDHEEIDLKNFDIDTGKNEEIVLLEERIKKLEESEERLKSACADFANQLQSGKEQMASALKFGNRRLLERFLFFLDIFEKAIEMGKNSGSENKVVNKFLEGFEMTKLEFEKILTEQKVNKIDIIPLKDIFDPEKHEATSSRSDETLPNDIILEVLRNGYMLHENILRPSLIIINKVEKKTESNEESNSKT